ncbi:MAG: acylphosphatase [Bradyrhizobium sp.]|nr:MAG: acylphosphatase [Bradyrhizobium sp.]
MRADEVRRCIVVTGRVQGVGFRDFARRAALRLGVAGWVRNRRDGAVEALIAGPAEAVDALVAELRRGPPGAKVIRLTLVEAVESELAPHMFEVRTTE